jgi:hypothetical protein
VLHLGEELFEASPVVDPALVEVRLLLGESAADGLAGDGAAPLVVRAVALW